ncbi:unnamed protein product [Rhizoctonia solani]|uniref:Protein kinase domain-containing protein n=1 Tax=Rhizoctonia solani TaxID=456999 RepID=A0A8H2WC56_9AGAM|nr:unnamed protein product [Rhizoctonia solani]
MDKPRPLSVAELTERAKPTGYSAKRTFKTSLRIALDEISAGQSAKDTTNIEQAFIHFTKAHTLLTKQLPTHPRYSELEPHAQEAVIWKGHEVEIWLNETKALVGRSILDWKLRHLDIPSTPRPRVYSDSGVGRTRTHLKASDPGTHLGLAPSPSHSASPLPTTPGDHLSGRGHRRTSSDVGKATSKVSVRGPEPNVRNRSLSPKSRVRLNLNAPSTSSQRDVAAGDGPELINIPDPAPRTPTIVVRKATKTSEQLEGSISATPSVLTNGSVSSIMAGEDGTTAVPSLILTDFSEEPSSCPHTPEESAILATPNDSTPFPAVQCYDGTNGPTYPSSVADKTRPRTLSETCRAPVNDQKKPPLLEQRPESCPPITTMDPLANKRNNPNDTMLSSADVMTVGTTSEFVTAPVALEAALMKGMDVSSDPEHPESIAKMEEEAVFYLELEQFERATNILIEVLKLRYRIQGENHLFTIQTMSNLGLGYEGQGKLDQAIQVLRMTLEYLKRSHSATNLRFRISIKERLTELIKRHEEAKKMMTIVRTSNLKRGPKRNNSLDQIATRVRFDEDLPLHIDTNTTPEAIMAHLTNRRCPNLTDLIDNLRCSKVPVNRGGFGDIWQGALTDGRPIAMKRIYQGERKLNKRLAQELYAWSKADHQNVLELLGLAYYRDYLVMISPWMQYGSVHEYLEKHPESNRLHLAIQVADGITHLHRIGMVHGDLKAQNIFVSHEGVLKVGDFGLAVMLGERSVAFQASTTGNNPQGTLRWMAPELFDESGRFNISMKSDIYSLGMTIYEIVSCRLPFWEIDNPMAVMAAVYLHKKIPTLPTQIQSMGKRGLILWDMLCRCWDHDPQKRPTANQVLREMHKVASH